MLNHRKETRHARRSSEPNPNACSDVDHCPAGAAALLHALIGHEMHALFAVAIALGLRPAEALGLRWRDLDLEAKYATLTVNQTVQRVRTSTGNEKRKRSPVIFEDAAKTQAGTGRVIVIPSRSLHR